MAINASVKPEVWKGLGQKFLISNPSYSKISTTKYEGDVQKVGSVVHVPVIGKITLQDYNPATGISASDVDANTVDVTITKDMAFNKFVDSRDIRYSGELNYEEEIIKSAMESLDDEIDVYLFATGSVADAGNVVADKTVLTPADVHNTLINLRTKLNKAKADKNNRFAILDSDTYGLLLQDSRYFSVEKVREDGEIYRSCGFELIESNALITDATYGTTIVAGVKGVYAKVAVIDDMKVNYNLEDKFGVKVSGRVLFGTQLLDNKAIATCRVKIGA